MQVFGVSVNWGLFIQGVQMNSTTGEILEAHMLTIPLQFEYEPSSQKMSTVYSCMDQLSQFFLDKGQANGLVKVYTASEKFFTDEVAKTQDRVMPYIAINIGLITVFCILTTVESDGSLKLIGGTFGLMTIGMSLLSGFGLMLYAGYSYNFMISATPFIVMCVGIDNDFLLLAAWRHTDTKKSSAQRLADSLTIAGPSVTITSLTDVICFLIGVVSGTLAVSSFCLFTAMTLLFR
uniref:SSD domain-containing protein n=1 Tax=Romanomermis culicivorax TaxID=13658 RepID=A0A915IJG1_ROMCU